jgi:hypothetical protein
MQLKDESMPRITTLELANEFIEKQIKEIRNI